MRLFRFLTPLLFSCCFVQGFAQKGDPVSTGTSLHGQLVTIIEEANNYQDYKVIKRSRLNEFQEQLQDSLEATAAERSQRLEDIEACKETLQLLRSQLLSSQDSLAAAVDEKNNIALLGVSTEKNVYKSIMWLLTGLLLAGLLLFVFKFKNSHAVTRQAQQQRLAAEEELAQYKKRSLEREQKLRRQLQDEINKQRGI